MRNYDAITVLGSLLMYVCPHCDKLFFEMETETIYRKTTYYYMPSEEMYEDVNVCPHCGKELTSEPEYIFDDLLTELLDGIKYQDLVRGRI